MSEKEKTVNKRKEGDDTMAATTKNYVYEVKCTDSKKIIAQPAASKAFLEKCKQVAKKYQKKK